MPQSLLDKIFDYHFSSNNSSNESYKDFDDHLYDKFGIRHNSNRMSG